MVETIVASMSLSQPPPQFLLRLQRPRVSRGLAALAAVHSMCIIHSICQRYQWNLTSKLALRFLPALAPLCNSLLVDNILRYQPKKIIIRQFQVCKQIYTHNTLSFQTGPLLQNAKAWRKPPLPLRLWKLKSWRLLREVSCLVRQSESPRLLPLQDRGVRDVQARAAAQGESGA